MNKVIDVHKVMKTYTSRDTDNLVLNSISFDLCEREVVAIMGESGAGKTTLLNVLESLDMEYEGNVLVFGKPLKSYSKEELNNYRAKKIGIVKQNGSLIDYMNVYENILLSWTNEKKIISSIEREIKIKKIASIFKIDHLLYKNVCHISGGEYQRCVWARALVKEPAIFFADEPTSALDLGNALNMMEFIKELTKIENTATIIATHDLRMAACADKILYLSNGFIKYEIRKSNFANQKNFMKEIMNRIYE